MVCGTFKSLVIYHSAWAMTQPETPRGGRVAAKRSRDICIATVFCSGHIRANAAPVSGCTAANKCSQIALLEKVGTVRRRGYAIRQLGC